MSTIIPSIVCLGVIGRNNNPLHLTILPSYDPASTVSSAQSIASPPSSPSSPTSPTSKPASNIPEASATTDPAQQASGEDLTAPTAPTTTTAAALTPKATALRTPLQFSLLLSSTLDVFELRARTRATAGAGGGVPPVSGDLGLLCAVDERLACYGYETPTGVRFVAVVDMRGRLLDSSLPPPPPPPPPSTSSNIPSSDPSAAAVAGPISSLPPLGPYGPGHGVAAAAAAAADKEREKELETPVQLAAMPPLSGIGLLSPTAVPAGGAFGSGVGATPKLRKTNLVASVASASTGLRDADLKPLFRAMQTAWVRLLQNPFFELDEHVSPSGRGGRKITNRKFADDMRKLGSAWIPGVGSFVGY